MDLNMLLGAAGAAAVIAYLILMPRNAAGNIQKTKDEVMKSLSRLPEDQYTIFSAVSLLDGEERVTADYIVISEHGIIVVTVEKPGGLIAGEDEMKEWYNIYRKKKYPFPNPVLRSSACVEAAAELLGTDKSKIKPVIVFSTNAKVKATSSTMLTNTLYLESSIRKMTGTVFTADEKERLSDVMLNRKL
jgi:Nuclease-related domain.